MKTIEKIKKEAKNLGLNVELVIENLANIKCYKYIQGKLYYSKVSCSGKILFNKEFRKEVNLYDYV